jgi:hypothetical protein
MTWLWLFIGCAFVLALGDVLLYLRGGVQATISRHVIGLSYRYPLLPLCVGLAVGILGGHLFWGQRVLP